VFFIIFSASFCYIQSIDFSLKMVYNQFVPDIKGVALIERFGEIYFNSVYYRALSRCGILCFSEVFMASRVGVISIIVENGDSVEELNALLHKYGEYIIGRMGIPYRQRNISLISVAIDAPQDVISTLSGKIGNLKGISAKTVLSNVISDE